MINNTGGIRWQDGSPAYNKQLKLTASKENIEELVEYIVDAMDVSALESFVKENLTDYYCSDEGWDDFQTNYLEMKEIKGDE